MKQSSVQKIRIVLEEKDGKTSGKNMHNTCSFHFITT
uniref:Uncharacterized protein n=1 Tax=Arundo donax TaxID=35708 RepID=A0A0A9H3P2_ARUDO